MDLTDLEQRKNDIFVAIVEAHIAAGAPVGSELISRKLRQSLSPATIRNVMSALEEDGLLEQPHTSAGRVPTDRGYRYYVDSLMQVVRLSPEEIKQLADTIRPSEPEAEPILERVSEALAQISHHASFVVAPTVKRSTIKQIELLPLGVHKLLCVLVGQEPFLASHMVDMDEPISRDEAVSVAHFLNTELAGLPTSELVLSLERRLLAGNDSFYHLVKRSLAILQHVLDTEPDERLLVGGAAHLFEYPEFHNNPRQVHELLRQLELQHGLLERLRADLAIALQTAPPSTMEGTRVRIGHEVGLEGLETCSYIMAPFTLNQVVVGGVGILGPKRMDYRRMCAWVESAADLVTRLYGRWEQGGEGAGHE